MFITGLVLYFDNGSIYNSVSGFFHSTNSAIYNTVSGFFHSASSTNLIDPDTPSVSSGLSQYFGQGENPTSPATSAASSSTSTVKPGGLLVDTKVEPSSSLLTSRSGN